MVINRVTIYQNFEKVEPQAKISLIKFLRPPTSIVPKWDFEPVEVLLTPIAKWSKIVGYLSGKWKKVSKNHEPNRETESGVV